MSPHTRPPCLRSLHRCGGEGEGFYVLSLTTCSNQFLVGTQQVAWLHFTAAPGQSSAFVSLNLDNGVGVQVDGTELRNFAPQAGRTVVVGAEPLLEGLRTTNGMVQLILYAPTGTTNVVLNSVELGAPALWLPWQQVVATNLFYLPPLFPATNQTMLFRAVRQ